MDEEDEGSKFCEEDIDQILQRRTQTITIQTEGKGSTFAKVLIFSSMTTFIALCFIRVHSRQKTFQKCFICRINIIFFLKAFPFLF